MPIILRQLVVDRVLVFIDDIIGEVLHLGTYKIKRTDAKQRRRGADAVSVFAAASLCAFDAE